MASRWILFVFLGMCCKSWLFGIITCEWHFYFRLFLFCCSSKMTQSQRMLCKRNSCCVSDSISSNMSYLFLNEIFIILHFVWLEGYFRSCEVRISKWSFCSSSSPHQFQSWKCSWLPHLGRILHWIMSIYWGKMLGSIWILWVNIYIYICRFTSIGDQTTKMKRHTSYITNSLLPVS